MTKKYRDHTLQDIIDHTENNSKLSPRQRRDRSSAARTLARGLGRPPSQVPASPSVLRQLLIGTSNVTFGCSKKRYQNILSEVATANRDYCKWMPPKSFTAEWREVIEACEDRGERYGISSFARFCSSRDHLPSAVSNEVFGAYLVFLKEETLRRKPTDNHRRSARMWNRVADRLDLPRVEVPSYRRESCVRPESAFQTDFIRDLNAHLDWIGGKELFAEHNPPHVCKPRTISLRRKQILIMASSAVDAGLEIRSLGSLGDLTSEATLKLALEGISARHDLRSSPYVRDLFVTMYQIRKHWVRAEEEELKRLRNVIRRMAPQRPGMTRKNKNTLLHLDDESSVRLVLSVPWLLMERANGLGLSPYRRAISAQLAVAWGLLIFCPMRMSNLSQLSLDRHFSMPRGFDNDWHIHVPGTETKNGEDLCYSVNPMLAELLRHYVKVFRPHITRAKCDWLFPGQDGVSAKSQATLAQQITELSVEMVGFKITPHQFRHISAKVFLDRNPGQYELVRQLLGHKNMKTTLNFYAGMETAKAFEHFDRTILGIVQGGDL